MSQTAIDAKLEAEFAAVAAGEGCELVHVDYRQGRLRVFLDRPQGVTLDDCQTVSKQLSALLDLTDFGKARYLLEVSSPGLDRELFGPRDFERFRGQLVRVTYFDGQPRAKRTIVGRLEEFQPEAGEGTAPEARSGGYLRVREQPADTLVTIPLNDLKKARLEPEL
jgi:ribosome maturation factor RimP